MNRAYVLYCRIAAVVFAVFTVYPVITKHAEGRLEHDWLHSLLHLGSCVFGAYAGWRASGVLLAKLFTGGIGVLYFGLGIYGWFTPGFFLGTRFAIPLGVVDNVFHVLLSLPALTILALDALGSAPAERRP